MSANDELQAHTCEKILQECGDVANNVAQANSQDLTEKWKKGELEIDKNYYLRFADGTEEIQLYVGAFLMRADNEVVEVLAPVPSYQEYMSLVFYKEDLTKACKMRDKIIKKYEDIDDWWKKENQQLKELLKECRTCLKVEYTFSASKTEEKILLDLLTKINKTIGEEE